MTMRRSSVSFATFLVGVALIAGIAGASPEPWVHPDGTIHYYDVINTPSGINWNAAFDSAEDYGGYLATITSQTENNFVFSLIDSTRYWYQRPGTGKLAGPWLGGSQLFGSQEPDSGWHWGTSESMNFLNWSPGQPDNNGSENAIHFGESAGVRVPTWDDAAGTDDSIRGLVRELSASKTTLGLTRYDSAALNGYTLFSPGTSTETYLIDKKGRIVHSWPGTYTPAAATVLLPKGTLFRAANLNNPAFKNGGRVEEVDWNGNVTWGYTYSDSTHCQHHDAIVLPNGHVVMIAFEKKSKAEAIAAGRDTTKLRQGMLCPEELIEVDPANNDNIVWQWHLWDHVIQDNDSTKANYGVVGNHPELVDLNFFLMSPVGGNADWVHANALDYNAHFDQIMVSAHNFDEIWIIDHSTTTAQAATHTGGHYGHGGDLLYRWGDPWAYRRGDSTNLQFFSQHNAQWIRDGLRGVQGNRPGGIKYSQVVEFVPPCDSLGNYTAPDSGKPYGPDSAYWVYTANPETSFYARNGSGAQRLPNGNTLICEQRNGRFFEITPDTQIVWTYINPTSDTTIYNQGDTVPYDATGQDRLNRLFRIAFYTPDYPGLVGHDLTPGYPIERYTTKQTAAVSEAPTSIPAARRISALPNPFARRTTISFGPRYSGASAVEIFAVDGRLLRTLALTHGGAAWDGTDNAGRQVSRGIYYCRPRGSDSGQALKLVKLN